MGLPEVGTGERKNNNSEGLFLMQQLVSGSGPLVIVIRTHLGFLSSIFYGFQILEIVSSISEENIIHKSFDSN